MSNITGIIYPNDGKPLFQEDFQREQNAVSDAILKRELDFVKPGIISGFAPTIGVGILTVEAGLARDSDGKRIVHDAPIILTVPDDYHEYRTILKHAWRIGTYLPDSQNSFDSRIFQFDDRSITLVDDTYEVESNEFVLYTVRRSGDTVEILSDNRCNIRLRRKGEMPIGHLIFVCNAWFEDSNNANPHQFNVDAEIPEDYVLFDGQAPNDPESPVFNTPDRHVPNLTNDIFIMGGNGSVGETGGSNVIPDHAHPFALEWGGHWSQDNANDVNNDNGDGIQNTYSDGIGGVLAWNANCATNWQSENHSHVIGDPGHSHEDTYSWISDIPDKSIQVGSDWGIHYASDQTSHNGTGITGTGGISANHNHLYYLPNHRHWIKTRAVRGTVGTVNTDQHSNCPNFIRVKVYGKIK